LPLWPLAKGRPRGFPFVWLLTAVTCKPRPWAHHSAGRGQGRSLISMGLPAERVSLSATTSASVQSDEVRLYVR
jgi:hypothetical protein